MRRAALSIAAAPVVAAVVCTAIVSLGLAGVHTFWPEPAVTLPEAVALRAGWEVLQQIRGGVSPDVTMPVRRVALPSGPAAASAWEAAVVAERVDVLELLAREGIKPAPEAARAAVCLAHAYDRQEALNALIRLYAVDPAPACPSR